MLSIGIIVVSLITKNTQYPCESIKNNPELIKCSVNSKCKNQSGQALVIVLSVFLILSLLGAAIMFIGTNSSFQDIFSINAMQAYYLARSGADAAAHWIIDNPQTFDNMVGQNSTLISKPVTIQGVPGSCTVTITKQGSDIKISSSAKVNKAIKTVNIYLKQVNDGSGTGSSSGGGISSIKVALFASDGFDLNGSPEIDGDAASNTIRPGSISLTGAAKINGALSIGPEGDTSVHKNTSVVSIPGYDNDITHWIIGGIINLPVPSTYSLPQFPDEPTNLPQNGSFYAGWWPSPPYTISSDGQYNDITVDSTLNIVLGSSSNPVTRLIRVGNLTVRGSGKIVLQGVGTLKLFVDNNFTLNGSASINKDGSTSLLYMFYGGNNQFTIPGSTVFNGNVYVKNADINLQGSGSIQGNIISGGQNVNLQGASLLNGQVLYAPDAVVNLDGSSKIVGSLIAKQVSMSGAAVIKYNSNGTNPFPGLFQNYGYEISCWSNQ